MIDRWKSSRGAGSAGCLFSLILLLSFGYISYQLVPIYYSASQFKDEVDTLVRRTVVRAFNEDKLRNNILDLAGRRGIPLKKENLKIQRLSDRVLVDVQYDREFRSPVYSRFFHFSFQVESFSGAL
jgi:hypothetical protein